MQLAIPFCIFFAFRYHPWCHPEGYVIFSNFRQFSPFRWSNFDLELIYFALYMNTSSYSPIASGTYNHWKVDFFFKTKMTKTSIQRRLWRNFIQRGLVVPIFIHSRSLLVEGNASLKCVYSGLTTLSTIFQLYHWKWCLVGIGNSVRLGGSHFYTYNSDVDRFLAVLRVPTLVRCSKKSTTIKDCPIHPGLFLNDTEAWLIRQNLIQFIN